MRIKSELVLYSDGSCSQATGGWGAVVVNPNTEKHVPLSGGPYNETTNNQMEMMAVIEGLNFIYKRIGPSSVLVISDSQYVINGATKWIHGWKKNGWFTADKKPVKNAFLWRIMEQSRSLHKITRFEWVKGHNGNRFNEMADELAVMKRASDEKALGVQA